MDNVSKGSSMFGGGLPARLFTFSLGTGKCFVCGYQQCKLLSTKPNGKGAYTYHCAHCDKDYEISVKK